MPYQTIRGKVQNNPGGDVVTQGLRKAGNAVKSWLGKGAPLPGATAPKPGMTYLRGRQVPMPGYKKPATTPMTSSVPQTSQYTQMQKNMSANSAAGQTSNGVGVGVKGRLNKALNNAKK